MSAGNVLIHSFNLFFLFRQVYCLTNGNKWVGSFVPCQLQMFYSNNADNDLKGRK